MVNAGVDWANITAGGSQRNVTRSVALSLENKEQTSFTCWLEMVNPRSIMEVFVQLIVSKQKHSSVLKNISKSRLP